MTTKQDRFTPGILEWYQHKMAQPHRPTTESQSKILQAYSNYLLKEALPIKTQDSTQQ
jgi:hypothetical protein